MHRESTRDLLSRIDLFAGMADAQLDEMALGSRQVRVGYEGVIFRHGDPCAGFHVVIQGRVKLRYIVASGKEQVVRIIGPGGTMGDAMMYMGHAHIVTAEALCDTLLLYVPREVLFRQLDRDPQLARRLLSGLGRQVYMLVGDLGAYTLRSGLQRLVGYLFRESGGIEGRPFRVEVSKRVIASRLNLTPAHFSRILRELIEHGLIRVRGREFTILDAHALRDYQERVPGA